MQITINQKVAAIVGGTIAIAAIGGGGFLAHRASVLEQNCLSYERQIDSKLTEGVDFINELATMKKTVDENPFMAFAYVGQIGDIQVKAETYKQESNNLNYAYRKTCGLDRAEKFGEKPEIEAKINHIGSVAAAM